MEDFYALCNLKHGCNCFTINASRLSMQWWLNVLAAVQAVTYSIGWPLSVLWMYEELHV